MLALGGTGRLQFSCDRSLRFPASTQPFVMPVPEDGEGDLRGGGFDVAELKTIKTREFLVGGEALVTFEGEVRKLRTMQAEALAGYHEVGLI